MKPQICNSSKNKNRVNLFGSLSNIITLTILIALFTSTNLKAQDALPQARCEFASVYFDGSWYIFGGLVNTTQSKSYKNFEDPNNNMYVFDDTANIWIKVVDVNSPSGRNKHKMVDINGKFYTFGGEGTDPDNFLRDTWVYDPATQTWTDLTPTAMGDIPNNVAGYGLTVYDNLMYLYGGHQRYFSGGQVWEFISNDIYSYNPETNYWQWINTGPSPKRSDFGLVEHDGQLFSVGGKDEDGNPTNNIWVYDYNTNLWNEIVPAGEYNPSVFYGAEATKVKIQDQWWIMIFGGGTNTNLLNDVWGYNIAENLWKMFDAFPSIPFFNPEAFFFEPANKASGDTAIVTIFGGRDELGNLSNQFKRYVFDLNFCDVYDYDTLNIQWVPEGTIGILQAEIIPEIKIYPNPANDIVNIEFESKKNQTFTISLFSINGKLLEQKILKGTSIKTKFATKYLNKGVYMITISNGNKLLFRNKITKQ